MEPPASSACDDIQAAKVALLRDVETLSLDGEGGCPGAFLGQFTANEWAATGGALHAEDGYKDDPGVPADSTTPTFAAVTLRVNNDRWRGVPFLMKAGKGLDERLAEVRVTFKPQPYNAVGPRGVDGVTPPPNELVVRIQPGQPPCLPLVQYHTACACTRSLHVWKAASELIPVPLRGGPPHPPPLSTQTRRSISKPTPRSPVSGRPACPP